MRQKNTKGFKITKYFQQVFDAVNVFKVVSNASVVSKEPKYKLTSVREYIKELHLEGDLIEPPKLVETIVKMLHVAREHEEVIHNTSFIDVKTVKFVLPEINNPIIIEPWIHTSEVFEQFPYNAQVQPVILMEVKTPLVPPWVAAKTNAVQFAPKLWLTRFYVSTSRWELNITGNEEAYIITMTLAEEKAIKILKERIPQAIAMNIALMTRKHFKDPLVQQTTEFILNNNKELFEEIDRIHARMKRIAELTRKYEKEILESL